jgi:hypothetical protein
MIRFIAALLFATLVGATAMAKDGGGLLGIPADSQSSFRHDLAPAEPSPPDETKDRARQIVDHWRRAWGDEPLPPHIQKKYNLKPDAR